jgi:hypothetical protein
MLWIITNKNSSLTEGITNVILAFSMKTAISIPDKLFKAAELLAKRLGVSRSELYQIAVAKMIAEHNDDATTEALNKIYGDDPGITDLDPALNQLQLSSLEEDDW